MIPRISPNKILEHGNISDRIYKLRELFSEEMHALTTKHSELTDVAKTHSYYAESDFDQLIIFAKDPKNEEGIKSKLEEIFDQHEAWKILILMPSSAYNHIDTPFNTIDQAAAYVTHLEKLIKTMPNMIEISAIESELTTIRKKLDQLGTNTEKAALKNEIIEKANSISHFFGFLLDKIEAPNSQSYLVSAIYKEKASACIATWKLLREENQTDSARIVMIDNAIKDLEDSLSSKKIPDLQLSLKSFETVEMLKIQNSVQLTPNEKKLMKDIQSQLNILGGQYRTIASHGEKIPAHMTSQRNALNATKQYLYKEITVEQLREKLAKNTGYDKRPSMFVRHEIKNLIRQAWKLKNPNLPDPTVKKKTTLKSIVSSMLPRSGPANK